MNDELVAVSESNSYRFDGRDFSILEKDGEFWFVAPEVARELGYRSALDLTRLLDDDEKGTHNVRTPGGPQEMSIISEPGLYRAIVQRRSSKKHGPETAERIGRFQRWVFHDVLPSIRKTGGYGAAPAVDPLKVLNDPAAMRGLLLTYSEKVIELEAVKAELQPKAEALARIAESDGSLCVTDAAKTLQVRPGDLFKFLRSHKWVYRRPATDHDVAYQTQLMAGLLEHKTTTVHRSDGSEKITTQVRVTPKGLARLAQEFPPHLRSVA